MNDSRLRALRDLVQRDVAGRGLATDPNENLFQAASEDLAAACADLACAEHPHVAIATGFWIAYADPPCGETDGPLGAVFLARTLVRLGITISLMGDAFCAPALTIGLEVAGLKDRVRVHTMPAPGVENWDAFRESLGPVSHLVALERVGPGHTAESVAAQPGSTNSDLERFLHQVPAEERGKYRSMRGIDITASMSAAHRLFEEPWPGTRPRTIGIGDGGNEIGMGKIPWALIARNVPRGNLTACRVATDRLIVAGISNWGAYALAAGVRVLRKAPVDAALFDPGSEREILRAMVEKGPLVDGMSGRRELAVDGLTFDRYAEVLPQMQDIVSH